MNTMNGCPIPPSAFQRPGCEGGPAFEMPERSALRTPLPDRTASASSVESLKSPFASINAEVDDLCIDDYLDEEERAGQEDADPLTFMSDQVGRSLSRPSGSSLKSTPSLPWSENSFHMGRSSLNASTGSLLGDMSQAFSRGLDSVASTRASSIIPCIPEGPERAGSAPDVPDVLPSPFSDPHLQVDDEPPAASAAIANGAVPSPAFYNPLVSGLKSLTGSEANLYLQLTEELANDPELTELLGAVALPGPPTADSSSTEAGAPPGGSGPNTELIGKLRHLLPTDSMKALLGQMASEAATRRQAAVAAAAASDAPTETAHGSGCAPSASQPEESASPPLEQPAGGDLVSPPGADNLTENVARGAIHDGAEHAPASADVGEDKMGSAVGSGEHPASADVGNAEKNGSGSGCGEWAEFVDVGGEKRKGSVGPPASQAATEPLLAADAASSAPTE